MIPRRSRRHCLRRVRRQGGPLGARGGHAARVLVLTSSVGAVCATVPDTNIASRSRALMVRAVYRDIIAMGAFTRHSRSRSRRGTRRFFDSTRSHQRHPYFSRSPRTRDATFGGNCECVRDTPRRYYERARMRESRGFRADVTPCGVGAHLQSTNFLNGADADTKRYTFFHPHLWILLTS